jgi:hypothetical protein
MLVNINVLFKRRVNIPQNGKALVYTDSLMVNASWIKHRDWTLETSSKDAASLAEQIVFKDGQGHLKRLEAAIIVRGHDLQREICFAYFITCKSTFSWEEILHCSEGAAEDHRAIDHEQKSETFERSLLP